MNGVKMKARRTTALTKRIISALNFTNLTDDKVNDLYRVIMEEQFIAKRSLKNQKPTLRIIQGGKAN